MLGEELLEAYQLLYTCLELRVQGTLTRAQDASRAELASSTNTTLAQYRLRRQQLPSSTATTAHRTRLTAPLPPLRTRAHLLTVSTSHSPSIFLAAYSHLPSVN